jgi:hypothetical protein
MLLFSSSFDMAFLTSYIDNAVFSYIYLHVVFIIIETLTLCILPAIFVGDELSSTPF